MDVKDLALNIWNRAPHLYNISLTLCQDRNRLWSFPDDRPAAPMGIAACFCRFVWMASIGLCFGVFSNLKAAKERKKKFWVISKIASVLDFHHNQIKVSVFYQNIKTDIKRSEDFNKIWTKIQLEDGWTWHRNENLIWRSTSKEVKIQSNLPRKTWQSFKADKVTETATVISNN